MVSCKMERPLSHCVLEDQVTGGEGGVDMSAKEEECNRILEKTAPRGASLPVELSRIFWVRWLRGMKGRVTWHLAGIKKYSHKYDGEA